MDGGIATTCSGIFVIPTTTPMIAQRITARKMPPFTFRAENTPIKITPTKAINTFGSCKEPKPTIVPGLLTIMPTLLMPIIVMKSPMPAVTASLIFCGIASKIIVFIGVMAINKNAKPAMSCAVNANAKLCPICTTTVYAKNALIPMPDTPAKGTLP